MEDRFIINCCWENVESQCLFHVVVTLLEHSPQYVLLSSVFTYLFTKQGYVYFHTTIEKHTTAVVPAFGSWPLKNLSHHSENTSELVALYGCRNKR